MSIQEKRILVGLGGGIAAFKTVELVRILLQRGAEVQVAMTPSATRFIGPITFSGITGRVPATDLFDPRYSGEMHIELSSWADAVVVAPATADLLARAVLGMANDVVLSTLLCAACPIVYAPAMHERMWFSAATQRNIKTLKADGAVFVGPVKGLLANGQEGMGRMEEPISIVDALEQYLFTNRDLSNRKIMVSAGPTLEDIDPVRFIGNRSSGRMGYAIAQRARERGAEVTLVSGPVEIPLPSGVETVRVYSAIDMHKAIVERVDKVDVIIMAAAVADYRPVSRSDTKIKKEKQEMSIELCRNPDILADLGQMRKDRKPILVGFAMETEDIVKYARDKLIAKKADLIIANEAAVGFGGQDNQATLISDNQEHSLPKMSKLQLADRILDEIKYFL